MHRGQVSRPEISILSHVLAQLGPPPVEHARASSPAALLDCVSAIPSPHRYIKGVPLIGGSSSSEGPEEETPDGAGDGGETGSPGMNGRPPPPAASALSARFVGQGYKQVIPALRMLQRGSFFPTSDLSKYVQGSSSTSSNSQAPVDLPEFSPDSAVLGGDAMRFRRFSSSCVDPVGSPHWCAGLRAC